MIVVGVSIVEDSTKLEFEFVSLTDESARIEMIESNLIHSYELGSNNQLQNYES